MSKLDTKIFWCIMITSGIFKLMRNKRELVHILFNVSGILYITNHHCDLYMYY